MKNLLVVVLFIILSCDDESGKDRHGLNSLTGKWDCYRTEFPDGTSQDGLQYAVLMNYEHGFETFSNGEYRSRYGNGVNFEDGFTTGSNAGTWQVADDTLTFTHVFLGITEKLHFIILEQNESKLVIKLIGVDNRFDDAYNRTHYLSKAD